MSTSIQYETGLLLISLLDPHLAQSQILWPVECPIYTLSIGVDYLVQVFKDFGVSENWQLYWQLYWQFKQVFDLYVSISIYPNRETYNSISTFCRKILTKFRVSAYKLCIETVKFDFINTTIENVQNVIYRTLKMNITSFWSPRIIMAIEHCI